MPDPSFRTRVGVAAALLLAATALLYASSHRAITPVRKPLKEMPLVLDGWVGVDLPLAERIVAAAGLDDYLQRAYTDDRGNQAEVYVGYYGSQRSGDLIHSPRNCLPAAGWEWLRQGRLAVSLPPRAPILVNDFRIGKGLQQDLVLYWYQGRGRAIASEYSARFWMIFDSVTRHRTDGSLVRVIVPIRTREADARALAVSFLQVLCPRLNEFIPE